MPEFEESLILVARQALPPSVKDFSRKRFEPSGMAHSRDDDPAAILILAFRSPDGIQHPGARESQLA